MCVSVTLPLDRAKEYPTSLLVCIYISLNMNESKRAFICLWPFAFPFLEKNCSIMLSN